MLTQRLLERRRLFRAATAFMTTGTLTQQPSVQPAIPGAVNSDPALHRSDDSGRLRALADLLVDQRRVWELAIAIGAITLLVNIINLNPSLKPLRWMSPAFALLALGVIYPIVYAVYVAFTNYGDGHLLTKTQVVQLLEQRTFVPETAVRYRWEAFINAAGEYALWLTAPDGSAFS